MTLFTSLKEGSILAKAAIILAFIFLISVGLCGLGLVPPSPAHQNRIVAVESIGLIGIIGSLIGLAVVGLIAAIIPVVAHVRRSITGKDPPP